MRPWSGRSKVNPQRIGFDNPKLAQSGQTADGTGWVLLLLDVWSPPWNATAYGMTVNVWLACEVPS